MEKIGFIGVGNMGGALAQVAAKTVGPEHLLVSSRTLEKAQVFAAGLGAAAVSNAEVAAQAEMIFLGVKPQKMAGVLEELKSILAARQDRFVLVSMAAGLTTNQISTMAGGSYPVLRIMPNTPAKIGKGVIVYCGNDAATPEDFSALEAVLQGSGLVAPTPEALIDAVSAVSGCGPAFVYVFIEALADAGVACGLSRAEALQYAAQTVSGAADMVLETGKHPGALKDEVCSPAGSTIAGIMALEKGGFRAAAEDAVLSAFRRNQELGK